MVHKYKTVLIEWIDAKGVTSEWEFWEDIEPLKPCQCFSIGFLIDDNKDYKTIAQNISGEQVLGRMCISNTQIIKMIILSIGES